MKQFFLIITALTFLKNVSAQTVGNVITQQAGQGVKEGAAIATDQTANKVLGKLFSKKNKNKKDTTTQAPSLATVNNNSGAVAADTAPDVSLQTYSKYDFVPGDKILVMEDFSQDAIGDFPDKWNTNSSGQVITINGQDGHWLMLNKKGAFIPEFINNLPDNFTLEFDLIYFGATNPPLELLLLSGGDTKDVLTSGISKRSGVDISIQPIPRDKGGISNIISYNVGENMANNDVKFQNKGNTKIKVSIWRQKQRLRVYLDQDKVFDLPRAFPAGKTYNLAMFKLISEFDDQNKYLIGNIKLAVGAPDTRNKLITEGKFSTTGILFDVNSATIKPESYGTIKDIADVLQDNANVRIKIIGHTDSDGDASMNLALSKKRAGTVKSFLVSEFKIDASRIDTDGKGTADPVSDNKTSEGKAQNRRVEFVKL